MISERERARALLDQALAEARSHKASRITTLYFVTYGASQETEANLRRVVQELSLNTLAEGAQLITWKGPNRFICWNCCALRFESEEEEAICPNCGHTAARIPTDIKFALDRIEIAESDEKEG